MYQLLPQTAMQVLQRDKEMITSQNKRIHDMVMTLVDDKRRESDPQTKPVENQGTEDNSAKQPPIP